MAISQLDPIYNRSGSAKPRSGSQACIWELQSSDPQESTDPELKKYTHPLCMDLWLISMSLDSVSKSESRFRSQYQELPSIVIKKGLDLCFYCCHLSSGSVSLRPLTCPDQWVHF